MDHFESNNNKFSGKNKSKKAKYAAALLLCVLFFLADWIHVLGSVEFNIVSFSADKYEVDVDEEVTFSWVVSGNYSGVWINFGDGENDWCPKIETSCNHSYDSEGKFNVTLTAVNEFAEHATKSLANLITVKNEAPTFDVSFSKNLAYEDEEVNVTAINIHDSDVDINNLTFVFDYGDGTSNTTSSSSFAHCWSTAGSYPVTVTAIDDQGALNQTTEYITIENKVPEAAFTLGVDLPATYSFSQDIIGKWPFGWGLGTSSSNIFSKEAIKVVDGQDSHQKVVKIEGKYYGASVSIKTNFPNQNYGTVEYYFYTTNTTADLGFLSLYSGATEAIKLFVQDGAWKCKGTSTTSLNQEIMGAPENNKWHHLRVDFRGTGTSEYFGLQINNFRAIVDGKIEDGSYSYCGNAINYLEIGALNKTIGMSYIDAIGLSWDENYEIGGNYNHFLSSYYGTYDFRSDIIGLDPQGWSVDDTDASDQGDYYGTNSFENNADGTLSTNIDFIDYDYSHSTCTVQVQDYLYGRHKVLSLYDNSNSGRVLTGRYINRGSGTVEFYVCKNNNYKTNDIVFRDGDTTNSLYLSFDYNGYIRYWTGTYHDIMAYSPAKWYHLRIEWDCAEDWHLWIDGKSTDGGNGYSFCGSPVSFDDLLMATSINDRYGLFMLDAWGESWDSDYSLGENLYSPLDLSVVDEGDNYKEVVRFQDKSTSYSVSMEDQIISQQYGTIEFYIKSMDVSSLTWAMTFKEGINQAFSVAMKSNKWQYTLNGATFYDLDVGTTPVNDQFYHVRIDFCADNSGYLGLSEDEFKITIDGNLSWTETVELNAINAVNKIRIESGAAAKGVSFIDAIGYSWDSTYQIGLNKYSIISYPIKSNMEFSAADSSDTASDQDSLRFYWNFGDNCSSYGKYVVHSYKTSGVYQVNLTVKDNNGAMASFSQLVLVHNTYPTIELTANRDNITINEGETISLAALSTDDATDLPFLSYWWDFNASTFDSLTLDDYEEGGWRTSHLYQDDFSGSAGVMTIDPEGAYNYSQISVIVNNVAPLVSVYDASILANLSFELYRSSANKNGNFSFSLYANEDLQLTTLLNFTGSSETMVFSDTYFEAMTLAKNWKILVNTTEPLPSNSWFKAYARLQFLDGRELVISSNKLYGGDFGNYAFNLNAYWFDSGNYHFMYPITFDAQAFDPSIDDVNVSISYTVNLLLEINCTNNLPISKTFAFNKQLGTAYYSASAFAQNGRKYANITVSQAIYQHFFEDNAFPVSLDFNFTLYPLVDLYEILATQLNLTQLVIFSCNSSDNYLHVCTIDDDGGEYNSTINFDTSSGIEFENLSPALNVLIPTNASLENTVTFYAQVSDYDQTRDQNTQSFADFKDNDVPSIPNDFYIANGSFSITEGDLTSQDNSYIAIASNRVLSNIANNHYRATYSFRDDSNGSNPAGWTVVEQSGCSVDVIASVGSHSKVVDIYDNSASYYAQMYNTFTGRGYGTFEFWYRTQDASKTFQMRPYKGSSVVIGTEFHSGLLEYYSGGWNTICPITSNTWYHFRVDFELTNGNYTGLAQDHWRIYVNGTLTMDNCHTVSTNYGSIDKILFWTTGNGLSQPNHNYIDAIGYSWDANYIVGDNTKFEVDQLDATIKFHMDNIEANASLKYCKLLYALKSSSIQGVNLSLYNFPSQAWDLIDSKQLNCSYWINDYLIINSVYINDSYDLLVRFEAYNTTQGISLFLDQLRLDYFWCEASDIPLFEFQDVPAQPDDFEFVKGTSQGNGSLSASDNNYSTFESTNVQPGLYVGTYSFTNDTDNSNPSGFVDSSNGGGCDVKVTSEIGGHKKVLELYDPSTTYLAMWDQTFTAGGQTSGTVELWFRSSAAGTNKDGNFQLCRDGTSNIAIGFSPLSENSSFTVNNGGTTKGIGMSLSANTWYHIRVDFECGNGNYTGLSADNWRLYVNCVNKGVFSFASPAINLTKMHQETRWKYGSYSYYIDALGYSWDSTYDVGDNLYMSSYELDFNANFLLEDISQNDVLINVTMMVTFMTNITQITNISLYDFNAEAWTLVNSDLTYNNWRTFSYSLLNTTYLSSDNEIKAKFRATNASQFKLLIDLLKINYSCVPYYLLTNTTRTESYAISDDYISFDSYHPNPGYYPATYSFTNDANGADPSGWTDWSGSGCYAQVIASKTTHSKCYEIYDNNNPPRAQVFTSFTSQTHGTYEFYFFTTDPSKPANLLLMQDGTIVINLWVESGYLNYYDTSEHIIRSMSANTWYHIRVDFECTNGGYQGLSQYRFHCYVDGTHYGDYMFEFNQANANTLYFGTSTTMAGYFVIDALGCSWDSNYAIGDNRYPTAVLDQTLDLDLEDMDAYRLNGFKSANLSYSFKTTELRNATVSIFNFTANSWTQIESVFTDNSSWYTNSFTFNSTDYITSDFKIKIRFYALNETVDSFKCYLKELDLKYEWYPVWIDHSFNELYHECFYNENMSSQYSFAYEGWSIFTTIGQYLLIATADDGYFVSKRGQLIEILNPSPYCEIHGFPNETAEDQSIAFDADLIAYGANGTDYRFAWDWGDGTFSFDQKTSHAWANSGTYDISLYLVDCYGNWYQDNATITVLEKAPEIAGPFTFYGAEGQAIVLEVEIYDAFLDEIGLSYEWFNSPNQILANRISTDKKPVVFLNDGTYVYSLKVTDSMNQIATANITIVVEDIAPSVFVGSYLYRGTPNGELDLHAYGLDSHLDIDGLKFYWTIAGANYSHTEADETGGRTSHITFDCVNTTIYTGSVKVVDDFGKTGFATFSINVFIDSNGNGLSDEFEYQLALNNESINEFTDSDSDFLTDFFENGISLTNSTNPDTDGDGLWDGFNNETGIGELTIGTDPKHNDTDDDGLWDNVEYFGWNRTIDLGNVMVTSNPITTDTDSDGLNDYEEYLANADPRNPDTDNDGLEDGDDPYPTKWDGDGDGLSDKVEIDLGTQANATDTDGDGLSDGEEVLGWAFKTNPLSADSDHDFLSDSAETKTYTEKIDARRELSSPVSLSFEHDCVKAASAQFSLALSYGEANADYGVQTVPDIELYVTKKENNLLLYNATYNGSRYISEVLDLVKILTDLNVTDFNYRGEYVLRINNTNAGCLLEQFELEVAAYLDPNDADCDDDGLMDGVETSGYVEGTSTIDYADTYGYTNLTTNNGTTNAAWESFSLEIPTIGRVTDASLFLNVSSIGVPIGLGNIAIKLIKLELNETLTDPALIDFTTNFCDDHDYSWVWDLDLGAYLADDTIFELYSKYELQVKVVQTTVINNTLDNFTLSSYSITTDGWRAPEADETWGWATDSAASDTDGDGWSDSYEIFGRTEPTNPLSPDTDGDGAWDANDRDPLRDLVLEIELVEGYHGSLQWWEHSPELQICVSFEANNKDYFFVTEPVEATQSANQWGSKRKASFDSTYYVDVNDKKSKQGNEISLEFELWHEGPKDCNGKRLWDTRLLSDDYDYEIDGAEHYEAETLYEDGHHLEFKITTLGIERANTIAVHENGTVFNGHYAAQEKVSLVKFTLSDDGENTPFVSGENVIITPTSLFTSTLLNAKLQHQQQDETPLSDAGFGSVDRDEGAESDGATDEVDFFYDAGSLTSTEATALLNSILEFVAGDDGNYTGTYSFENDAIGALPIGWTNSSTNGTTTEVVEEKDGHNTVLQLTDNLIGCENRTNVYTNFSSQAYGTVEGWLYVDEGSARVSIGTNDNIALTFNITGVYATNGSTTILASAGDFSNEWHHYRVEFECGTGYNYNLAQGEYRVYLDNESRGEYLVKSGTSYITQFGFSTWTSNDTTFYADAIGFSWDANYAVGENYQCGNVTDFYAYDSTKLNGFSPCLMNLPTDALQLIDWVRNYENSEQGSKPQNANAYWKQWWASVWDEAQEEFQKAIDALVVFFMENFPWAWLLIRAAMLIFLWMINALVLVILNSLILIFNNTILEKHTENFVKIDYDIQTMYYNALDLEIPNIFIFNLISTETFELELNYFDISMSMGFLDMIGKITNSLIELPGASELRSSSENNFPFEQFGDGFGHIWEIFGRSLTVTGALSQIAEKSSRCGKFLQILVVIFGIYMLFLEIKEFTKTLDEKIDKLNNNPYDDSGGFLFGFMLGTIILCVIFKELWENGVKKSYKGYSWIKTIFTVYFISLSFNYIINTAISLINEFLNIFNWNLNFEFTLDLSELIKMKQIFQGALWIIAGLLSIFLINDSFAKELISLIFFMISYMVFGWFMVYITKKSIEYILL